MSASLKTMLKNAVFAVGLDCGFLQLRDLTLARLGHARAVILTYHRVGGCDVLTRPSEVFRRDVEWLTGHFECLTLAELCARLGGDEPVRRPLAVVTFDDGYRDNAIEAAPILRDAGLPATFFVATGYVGTNRKFPHDHGDPGRRWPKLTWDDLRAMQNAGFEIGSHTVNHCYLGTAVPTTVEYELCESLAALTRELGECPRAFAYPWGTRESIPLDASRLVAAAGYYAAVTTRPGSATAMDDPMALPRIDVGNCAISPAGFRARVMQMPGVVRSGSWAAGCSVTNEVAQSSEPASLSGLTLS